MTRLVTYGCSFTEWNWSSWADILAKNLDIPLVNRALRGCGNNFIFTRLKHDLENRLIHKDDKVRIMWCWYNRVSKIQIIDGIPELIGRDEEPLDRASRLQNLTNTIEIIQASEKLLSDYDYEFMTWMPLQDHETNNFPVRDLFRKKILPPLVDIVMDGSWEKRTDYALCFDKISKPILKNINKQSKKQKISVVEMVRQNIKSGDGKYIIFFDYHPTPLMHLEYLQTVYPDMKWQSELIDQIHRENQEVLSRIWSDIW